MQRHTNTAHPQKCLWLVILARNGVFLQQTSKERGVFSSPKKPRVTRIGAVPRSSGGYLSGSLAELGALGEGRNAQSAGGESGVLFPRRWEAQRESYSRNHNTLGN